MMVAASASCVRAFFLSSASRTPTATPRVDDICMKTLRCPALISFPTFPCLSHSAISCSFSTLQLLPSSRTWRLPRFSALATGSSELDQDVEAAGLSSEATDEEGVEPIQFPAATKLYVGNLPWTCDSQQVAEL
eukprot:c39185_g1_i1 orf=1-399(-)